MFFSPVHTTLPAASLSTKTIDRMSSREWRCHRELVRSDSVLSDNRRVPDRADVLGAHRAAGVGEQAPRACELAEMRAVRADREQLVAVGNRPEGLAGRIESDAPRSSVDRRWRH